MTWGRQRVGVQQASDGSEATPPRLVNVIATSGNDQVSFDPSFRQTYQTTACLFTGHKDLGTF